MHKVTGIGLFLTTMLIAGCGGGSGSGSGYSGPTAPVAITTQTEANAVAGQAANSATSSSVSSITGSYTPLVGGTADTSPSPAMLGNLTRRFADMAFQADTSTTNQLSGVSQSQSQACPGGGTITVTVNVADPNATQPSAGDSVKFAFHNCAAAGYVTTGSIKFVVNNYVATSTFSASYTFSDFKEKNIANGDYVKINGSYTAGVSSNGTDVTFSITGTSLVFKASVSGTVKQLRYSNFSLVDILYGNGDLSFDHDITIASTDIGGSITVNTVTAFVIPAGGTYPTSGQLVLTGANNAKVSLTAMADGVNVFVEYDIVPVDGIYESNATVPWASL